MVFCFFFFFLVGVKGVNWTDISNFGKWNNVIYAFFLPEILVDGIMLYFVFFLFVYFIFSISQILMIKLSFKFFCYMLSISSHRLTSLERVTLTLPNLSLDSKRMFQMECDNARQVQDVIIHLLHVKLRFWKTF